MLLHLIQSKGPACFGVAQGAALLSHRHSCASPAGTSRTHPSGLSGASKAFQVLKQWGQGQAPQASTTGPSLAAGWVHCRSSSSSGSAVTSKQGIALQEQPAVLWKCMPGTSVHLPEGLVPKRYRCEVQEMLQMGVEGQAHVHLSGLQAMLSPKVSSSSAASSAPHQVLPVLKQPAEIISRSLPAETPQNASSSNPATTLGMTQALPLSRSQQAKVASSPDCPTQPSEPTADQLQGQALTTTTVRSASPNRFATQQLRTVSADLLAYGIHSSAIQSGHVEPASIQRTVLPPQSGATTRWRQSNQGINFVESHAEATGHAAAAQPRLARWPNHLNDPQEPQQWQVKQQQQHSLQQHQQQQQPPSQQQHATNEPWSRQRPGTHASPSLQTPSLVSTLPLVIAGDDSIQPSSSKKRSTRLRSSKRRPSSSNKLCSGSFSSPSDLPSHWQTLGDVLKDINLNDIIANGCPLRKGAAAYAVAPCIPMYSPFQLVDTRPLAYLTMQSQENQTSASDLPPLSPPASFLMPLEHQPQGSQTPWQPNPHLQHLCQVHIQPQVLAQTSGQAQLDPSQHRQLHRAHAASQAENTISLSAHDRAAFLPTPPPSFLQEAPGPAGDHAVSIQQPARCTSGAVLSTSPGVSQSLQVANQMSFPLDPRSSIPAQSRTPFQAVELALNKLFGNPSHPANGSGQSDAQTAALTAPQPDPASDFPDRWQGGSHIPAHQEPQGSLLNAVWHQEALLAPWAASGDQGTMLATPSTPTGHVDALGPTSASQEPYAICDFHWQPVHQQQLLWSPASASALLESSQDMQLAQSAATTVGAHQMRQPQLDKTTLQLDSPHQALTNAAWQHQHVSDVTPLFGTPTESPIMQDGHGVFDRPQLVSSVFAPSKATKQVLSAISQQGPGTASQAGSAAMPASMLPSPCQVQASSATAQHPFLRKPLLPHALTMIPVPNHLPPQPAPTPPLHAAGQSRLQPSLQDTSELAQAELPGMNAVDEHRSMAEVGHSVQTYTLREIASSARHLLKTFAVAEDATSTAATEYRTSSALLCEEVCGAFHDASLHEDPMAGQEDHALPLPELADFISEPDALYQSGRLTGSAECVSPDAFSDDAAQQDSQYTKLRAAGFTADEIEESSDQVVIRESSVADLPNEADVLQVAALMSGKHSLRVEDLYSVCAHWQQTAGPHHKVLQSFGSSDLVVACDHIQRVLGESGRFVTCGQTEAGVMQWCLRHLDGVCSSSDQAEAWLASGQDFTDRMEQSCAAGLEEQAGKASLRHCRQQHARAVQEQQRILADCMPRLPKARSCSKKRKIRPDWDQVKLASSPPQQKKGKSKRKGNGHDHTQAKEQIPKQRYFKVALPQHTPSPEPADRSRTSLSLDTTQQALVPPAGQQRSPHPASVQPKLTSALKVILMPKAGSVFARPPSSSAIASQKTAGSAKRCLVALKPALPDELPATASEPGTSSLVPGTVKEQACTLKASATAVLKGLDWADSQLSCSSPHPAASPPARNSSTASSNTFEWYRAAAAAAGRLVAAGKAEGGTAHAFVEQHKLKPSARSQYVTGAAAQGPETPAVTGFPQQTNIGAAGKFLEAEQSGQDSMADSAATWSDSDHAGACLASSPYSRRTVVCGTNKQQLPGINLPVVTAKGPPTSSKAQCTASDSALAALPDLTALVNEDMFQRQFTAEEQHALLRLLPKADEQAASAGYNPLSSTHLKAAAATYLQLLQAGLLEDEAASCWLPSRCRCPMDEKHREARVRQWASRHFGRDAAHALTNGHTTAVQLVMNIAMPEPHP
ncbi:hypothetical protein WJX77_002793 [Trebouxia sp. C0004]